MGRTEVPWCVCSTRLCRMYLCRIFHIIPHHPQRHYIDQDILLDAGEAIERGVCAPPSDLAISTVRSHVRYRFMYTIIVL